jgi:transcriptional regulator with XRE-family HTH domain
VAAEGEAADYAAQIGERVRRLRHERGLSLSALALRAGIGKATLSGLEDGSRGNPTIETLYAVAGQLGVPLAAILPDPASSLGAPAVVPPEIRGAAVAAVLLESFAEAGVVTELFRLHIRPGQEQVSPPHPPGTVEYLTVFSGTARVGPVAEPMVVPTGGHVSWTADVPHSYVALGDQDVFASLVIRSVPRSVPEG